MKIELLTVPFRLPCYSIVLHTTHNIYFTHLHICCDQSDHVVVESIKSFRPIQSD